ncbi:MAG TPA: hypothetical protein VKA95_07605 [Nitrososphaeraceae archaeon]|jgi:hypothetical protein|nr:hypothetical protein [Nitrososphaeraceae archaeon]
MLNSIGTDFIPNISPIRGNISAKNSPLDDSPFPLYICLYNLKVKSLMHQQSSYMYMYWVRVPLMMDENNRLAKEQPELEELKREGVPLRMIREQKQDGSERLFIEKLVSN